MLYNTLIIYYNMYIIDKNMGGTGGLGGSVSRWNFEGNYKNATFQVLGKKN